MKRKIFVILSLIVLAGEVFAWSQLYCPRGCFQTKGFHREMEVIWNAQNVDIGGDK